MTTSVDVRKVTVQSIVKKKVLGIYSEVYDDAFMAKARIISMNGKISIEFESPQSIKENDRIKVGDSLYDITKGYGENAKKVGGKFNVFESNYGKLVKLGLAEFGRVEVTNAPPKDASDAFMDAWVSTFIKNVVAHYDELKNGEHIGKFHVALDRNVPVACVGAGPSLDKNVEHLRDFPGLILVADRAYKMLLARKIEPDFVICTDCHYDLIRDLLDCPLNYRHKLVVNSCSDPAIWKVWKGKIYSYNMKHPGQQFMDRILPALLPKVGQLECVGCVGNTSIVFADYIGCGDIVLVGQDFSYTGGRMHADAFEILKDGTAVKKRVNNKKLLENRTGKVVINGVETYLPFRENMLSTYALADCRKLPITNCTEGGIIQKLPQMALSEMVKKLRAEGKTDLVNKARKLIAKRGGI